MDIPQLISLLLMVAEVSSNFSQLQIVLVNIFVTYLWLFVPVFLQGYFSRGGLQSQREWMDFSIFIGEGELW